MKTFFQSKPIQLTAERFYPEKKPWPEGVAFSIGGDVPWVYVGGPDGYWRVINPGDWVVTGMNGERFVVKDEAFRNSFDWMGEIVFFRPYSDGHIHWIISGTDEPRRLPDWDSFIFRPQRFERYGVDFAFVSLYTVTMTYEAGVASAGQPHVCASCGLVDSGEFHRNVLDCLDAALKRIKELEDEKIPEGAG